MAGRQTTKSWPRHVDYISITFHDMRACIMITTCWLGLVLAELLVASISLKCGLLICSFVLCVRCVIDPGTGSEDIPASNQGEIRKKNTSRLLRFCSHDEYYRDGHAHAWYVRDIFRTLLCHFNHDNLSQKCLLIAFLSPFLGGLSFSPTCGETSKHQGRCGRQYCLRHPNNTLCRRFAYLAICNHGDFCVWL